MKHHLVADDAEEIARFFNGTSKLQKHQQKLYLEKRHDVLQHLVQLQDFNGEEQRIYGMVSGVIKHYDDITTT